MATSPLSFANSVAAYALLDVNNFAKFWGAWLLGIGSVAIIPSAVGVAEYKHDAADKKHYHATYVTSSVFLSLSVLCAVSGVTLLAFARRK